LGALQLHFLRCSPLFIFPAAELLPRAALLEIQQSSQRRSGDHGDSRPWTRLRSSRLHHLAAHRAPARPGRCINFCTFAVWHRPADYDFSHLHLGPAQAALSVIFIGLLFGGPGMVKAYLTLRTGNAWVHLWGYHVIWPHLTGDTPGFVKIFAIR